jgi:hypothetical protein
MADAGPKEGPRAPLFYGAIALAVAGNVHAQTVELSDLESCARLASPDLKLACFEAIIAKEKSVVEPPAEALVPEVPATADIDAVQAEVPESVAPAAATVSEAKTAEESLPAANSTLEPVPAADEAVATAAEPAAVQAEMATSTAAHSFGREHLESADEQTEILRAVVVDVDKDHYGALIFHLDNGQVWRQVEPRYFPYPRNQEFDVLITIGMMGDYRLQVGGTGRKVRIRRTK